MVMADTMTAWTIRNRIKAEGYQIDVCYHPVTGERCVIYEHQPPWRSWRAYAETAEAAIIDAVNVMAADLGVAQMPLPLGV